MTARITKLRLTDFRSIRGTVDLHLDAPVVLIHGPNGSGKTSLLLAIEMGLTGAVASLGRFDTAYTDNLVHYDAKEASISIACRHPQIGKAPTQLILRNGIIDGDPLLAPDLRRFYTERSFLAQATLGRLLEIYEHSDARKDQSPLTRFVKDLLGLDALDDLITGLRPAGDKRLTRRLLPLYADAEAHCARLAKEVNRLTEVVETATQAFCDAESELIEALEPLSFADDVALDDLIDILENAISEEAVAIELGEFRREVTAAQSLWEKVDTAHVEVERTAAEAALSSARKEYDAWTETDGLQVVAALAAAGGLIADLPSARRVGRLVACETAFNEVEAEMKRVVARLDRDQLARIGREKSQSDLDKAKARAARLDKRLDSLSGQSGDLAKLLSELIPFIDSDRCPVCERDFSEVSENSLHAHMSMHVARLSRTSGQLQEVTAERREVRKTIAEAERAVELHATNVLDDGDRTAFRTRSANLKEAQQMLLAAIPSASRGDEIAEVFRRTSNRLNALRQNQEALASIRTAAVEYPRRLRIAPATEEESTPETLSRCLGVIAERIEAVRKRENDRRVALGSAQTLRHAITRKSEADEALKDAKRQAKRANDALAATDDIRKSAKELSTRAITARTDIVRRVFNETLNEIWRDLFIRLAPEEPFIPAFAVPQSTKGPVEAHLETNYRGREPGGNPKSMLSAGNLNTAALTLFLSLHLSVQPLLPWLVIDDPVQSMDEIHIAQLAALLRTLSKQHDRQIIIAVHEKSLFDYLALELSPASVGDSLITVELSKGVNGQTAYDPNVQTWDPGRVFQATG